MFLELSPLFFGKRSAGAGSLTWRHLNCLWSPSSSGWTPFITWSWQWRDRPASESHHTPLFSSPMGLPLRSGWLLRPSQCPCLERSWRDRPLDGASADVWPSISIASGGGTPPWGVPRPAWLPFIGAPAAFSTSSAGLGGNINPANLDGMGGPFGDVGLAKPPTRALLYQAPRSEVKGPANDAVTAHSHQKP